MSTAAVAEESGCACVGEGRQALPKRLQHTDAEPAADAAAAAAERFGGRASYLEQLYEPAGERSNGPGPRPGGNVPKSPVTPLADELHGPDGHYCRLHE